MEKIDVVLLAAGSGVRFKNPVPKQFVELCGKPLLVHSLEVFEKVPYIGAKYIAVAPDRVSVLTDIVAKYQISNCVPVEGGRTRLESVAACVRRVQTRRVFVHLAVMPFITKVLLDRLTECPEPAVIPTLRPGPTISQGVEFMEAELDRSRLRLVQNPQLFDTGLLRKAHEKAIRENSTATEDGQIMFQYGAQVRFIEGLEDNIDIKRPLDWAIAEHVCRRSNHLAHSGDHPHGQGDG